MASWSVYLSHLAGLGQGASAALAGVLGAVVFAAELVGAAPMGVLSDAVAPRRLMTAGALLGGLATQLFGMTGNTSVFFLSRTTEGLGASATTPSLLAHLTDTTDGNPPLRDAGQRDALSGAEGKLPATSVTYQAAESNSISRSAGLLAA